MKFSRVNKFAGKSSYLAYTPAYTNAERIMESAWNEFQNKKLSDKRRDEEARLILNQWSQARSRMEAEIQRKKEQINFATNFEEARGFVRTNWKSFGYKIDEDPT